MLWNTIAKKTKYYIFSNFIKNFAYNSFGFNTTEVSEEFFIKMLPVFLESFKILL